MIDKTDTDSDYLTEGQVAQLLRAINGRRVGEYKKNSNLTLSHVEAYELRAHLNRIFGFARWSEDVIDQQLVFQTSEERPRDKDNPAKGTYTMWTVVYRSLVRLTICAPSGKPLATYTEGATGDNTGSTLADVHDHALKTSESQAFKRCCANLGDQFGLSLYRKGDRAALVKQTLLMPDVKAADEAVDEHVDTSVPESEAFEPPPDPRQTNAPRSDPEPPPASTPDQPAASEPKPSPEDAAKAEAEKIRAAAIGPVPDGYPSATKWITHLMGEAMKAKALKVRVEAFDTTQQIELRTFLEGCLSRAAAASRQDAKEQAS